MAQKRTKHENTRAVKHGGDWTTIKLKILSDYLAAYITVLKKQPFRLTYVDAFAGTGYREPSSGPGGNEGSQIGLFQDLVAPESQALLDGSAKLALMVEPPFDRYRFVERSARRCEELGRLALEFPARADRIEIRRGDANTEIRSLCAEFQSDDRAVMFLDPYGMNVEWQTIDAIARTKKVDLWLLFPVGIGVNRLLTRTGEIPLPWRQRLNLLLGTEDWYQEFYDVRVESDLFGENERRLVKAKIQTVGAYFLRRLAGIFAGVAPKPLLLSNSSNSPLYLFCFAAANPVGAPIALKIANHLLKLEDE